MEHIADGQIIRLKEAKTIKELKDALVEIVEQFDIELENVRYERKQKHGGE